MTSRNKYILCLQYKLMAFHQMFISKSVQHFELVLTGLEKKPKKANTKSKAKQNKSKTKLRRKK